MSMADLIGKIARNRNCGVISEGDFSASVGSGPPTGSGSGSRNRDSRCIIDLEAARGRRHQHHHHPSFVKFELRTIGTGADVGHGAAVERPRFTGDSDTLVNRSDSVRPPQQFVAGLEAPREVYHYGTYGVGMHGKPGDDVAVRSAERREESGSSGTSHGGEKDDGKWNEEDEERYRAQMTSRDGILKSPTKTDSE